MPNVTVQPTKPYDTVGTTLQLARTLCLDASGPAGVEGDLLSSSQPTTLILLNSAYRKLQDELVDAGVETLVKETVITALPAVALVDPSVSTYISWDGYFDGVTLYPQDQGGNSLPFDLIVPSSIWERPTGNGNFTRVRPVDGGLPEGFQASELRYYEWRDDKVWFKGAQSVVDIKVRYIAYQPDLTIDDVTEIPIMRAARAIAYMLASEWTRARGAPTADNLFAMAEAEIEAITNRTARRKASITYRRKSFGS